MPYDEFRRHLALAHLESEERRAAEQHAALQSKIRSTR